jgi:hypothetical protein
LILDVGTVDAGEGLGALHKVLRKAKSVNHLCHAIVILSEDQEELEGQIDFDVSEHTSVLKRPVRLHELTTKLGEVTALGQADDEAA